MKATTVTLELLLGLIAACLCVQLPLAKSQPYPDPPWTLDSAVVRTLEAKILMPGGAQRIEAYTRYYEPGYDNGRRIVFGVLTANGDKQIHTSGNLPIILDGGCSVVKLAFDVAASQMMYIACGGR